MQEKIIGKLLAYTIDRSVIGYMTINEKLCVRCYDMSDILTEYSAKNIKQIKISTGNTMFKIPKVEFTGDESELRTYIAHPARPVDRENWKEIPVAYNEKLGYCIILAVDNLFEERKLSKICVDKSELIRLDDSLTFEEAIKLHKDYIDIRKDNLANFLAYTEEELSQELNRHIFAQESKEKRTKHAREYAENTTKVFRKDEGTKEFEDCKQRLFENRLVGGDRATYCRIISLMGVFDNYNKSSKFISRSLVNKLDRLSTNRSRTAATIQTDQFDLAMQNHDIVTHTGATSGRDLSSFSRKLLSSYIYAYYPLMKIIKNEYLETLSTVFTGFWAKSIYVATHTSVDKFTIDRVRLTREQQEYYMNRIISKLYLPLEYYDCIINFVLDNYNEKGDSIEVYNEYISNHYTNIAVKGAIIGQYLLYVIDSPFNEIPDKTIKLRELRSGLSSRRYNLNSTELAAPMFRFCFDNEYLMTDIYKTEFKKVMDEYKILVSLNYLPQDIGYDIDVTELSEKNLNEFGYTLKQAKEGHKYKNSRDNKYTLKLLDIPEKDISKLKELGAKTIGDIIILGAIESYDLHGRNTMVFNEDALLVLKATISIFNSEFAKNTGVFVNVNIDENRRTELIEDDRLREYYSSGFCLYRTDAEVYQSDRDFEWHLSIRWATDRNIMDVGRKTSEYIVSNFLNKKLINLKRLSARAFMSDEHISKLGTAMKTGLQLESDESDTIKRVGNLRYI